MDINHISKELSADEVEKLRKMYNHYEELHTFYTRKYKRLKKINLTLNLTSVGLTTLGTVLAPFTSLFTLVISGVGVLAQTYLIKSNLSKRIEACSMASKSYKKVATQLRSYLRGLSYDESVLLNELTIINDMVTDSCAPAFNRSTKKRETLV